MSIFVEEFGDSQAEAIINCLKEYNQKVMEKSYPTIEVKFANIRQHNNKLQVRCSLTVNQPPVKMQVK